MNGEIDERVFKEVCKHIDFNNDENNIKARDNKKGVYKRRIFKNDKFDLLSQLTLLFYNKICNSNNNNNDNRDEIIKLKNENDKLKEEMQILKKENKELNIELNEAFESIDNNNKPNINYDKPNINYDKPNIKVNIKVDDTPSFFDQEEVINIENIDPSYDPYNQTFIVCKPVIGDYSNSVIDSARNNNSISYGEWNDLDDDKKLIIVMEYTK